MPTENPTVFNPTHLVLELTTATSEQAWSQSSDSASAASRWQNYLNRVSLNTFLPWLQTEEDATAKLSQTQCDQADIWELVNGTAIAIKDAKLILIPTEAEDLGELRVPQEWIDIPEWQADYYLAVQVNVDAGYLRIWGYATHQKLKRDGDFSFGDRTYTLSEDDLVGDINALWVARELCPDEVTQAAVEPIRELAPAQADNLIERLGNPAQLLPRLNVPFPTWAALIKDPNWCSRLAAARRGTPVKTPVLQWLHQAMSDLTTEFGWRQIELSLNAGVARGVAKRGATSETAVPAFGLAKQLTIADQPYELKILPLAEAGVWRFELCCISPGCMIPAGFKLRLLTGDRQNFPGNEDLAHEPVAQLGLNVALDPGESLIWEVEPTPDDYHGEILQF